jgi:hypothetical protein
MMRSTGSLNSKTIDSRSFEPALSTSAAEFVLLGYLSCTNLNGISTKAPVRPPARRLSARESFYSIRDLRLGDTPMMRIWKMIGLKMLILAALLGAAPALGSSAFGAQGDAEKPEDIQKQLTALKNSLAEVKKALEKGIEDIRVESNASAQKAQSQISDLSRQLNQLRLDVENLRTAASSMSRTALYPGAETGLSAGTGRVEMINTYSQPVSVVLNNRRSYFLAPGERRLSDPIPAGPFTYEVLGVTPVVTRTVAADKTFTIWVHPQL